MYTCMYALKIHWSHDIFACRTLVTRGGSKYARALTHVAVALQTLYTCCHLQLEVESSNAPMLVVNMYLDTSCDFLTTTIMYYNYAVLE